MRVDKGIEARIPETNPITIITDHKARNWLVQRTLWSQYNEKHQIGFILMRFSLKDHNAVYERVTNIYTNTHIF